MEIERLLKLEETDKDKIEMIISNNLDLMYKGKAAVTIDNWDNLVNEILAWRDYEAEKLILSGVSHQRELLLAFAKYVNGRIFSDNEPFFEDEVDEWIANNCG